MELVFVLVEPARSENVGAAARALNTMGFERLRLTGVDPNIRDAARHVAHGSTEVLDAATSFTDLAAAVADCELVIGTTARRRGSRREYLSPAELREHLQAHFGAAAATGGGGGSEVGTSPHTAGEISHTAGEISHTAGLARAENAAPRRAALVFGREESGLTNEELHVCHVLTSVPLRRPYPSLNLAQAVMVYAYELSSLVGSAVWTPALERAAEQSEPNREESADSVRVLHERAAQVLDELGFGVDRALRGRILERLGGLRGVDVRLAHSVLSALLRRLN